PLSCLSPHRLPSTHLPRSPPTLHSSPTRRSSDLAAFQFLATAEQASQLHFRSSTIGFQEGSRQIRGPFALILPMQTIQPSARRQDRKSTRLNSSHEWISYAVLCLNKKRTLNKGRR